MSRLPLLAALAFTPLLFVSTRSASAAGPVGCGNQLPIEPLVVHDITGFTLSGSILNQHLVVYSTGYAQLSSATLLVLSGPEGGNDGFSRLVFVSIEKAKRFHRELAAAGAFQLCDEPSIISDVPPVTLTMFKGETDATAHTFTYFGAGASAPYANVAQIVSAFISEHFPGF